jgi:predicted transcriptional regulator
MKTAISISDEVYERAERFARRHARSRSQLYAEALAEYLARHDPDEITAAMDRAVDTLDEAPDPAVAEAARRALERVEW